MRMRTMVVAALAVVATAFLGCAEQKVPAAAPAPAPVAAAAPALAGGTVRGILVGNTETEVSVKLEDAAEPVIYRAMVKDGVADAETVAAIRNISYGDLVEVVWKPAEGGPCIVSIAAVVPPAMEGVTVGTVMAKQQDTIDIKPAGEPTERYMPKWVGGAPDEGGAFDKAVVEQIAKTKVGDRVKVQWTYGERNTLVALEILPAAAPEKKLQGEKSK